MKLHLKGVAIIAALKQTGASSDGRCILNKFPSLLVCRVGVVIYRLQLHIGLELPKLVLKLVFLTLGNHFTVKMVILTH